MDDKLITCKEVAEKLHVTQATLSRWRSRGHGPMYIQYDSGRILYKEVEVERFIVRSTDRATRRYY